MCRAALLLLVLCSCAGERAATSTVAPDAVDRLPQTSQAVREARLKARRLENLPIEHRDVTVTTATPEVLVTLWVQNEVMSEPAVILADERVGPGQPLAASFDLRGSTDVLVGGELLLMGRRLPIDPASTSLTAGRLEVAIDFDTATARHRLTLTWR